MNQRAVRTQLEPRRQELLALLASLSGDESTDEQRNDEQCKERRKLKRCSGDGSSSLLCRLVIFVAMVIVSGKRDIRFQL